MTSPVFEPKAPRRRRRSSFKRQRLAVFIALGAVVLLAVALAVVLYFTSRTAFEDPVDGTKYYVVKEGDSYFMEDADGRRLEMTEDGNFLTVRGTLVRIDEQTGEAKVVAVVDTVGDETLQFSAYSGEFDVLMYPFLERKNIRSIEVHNVVVTKDKDGKEVRTVNNFTFMDNGEDDYEIVNYPDLDYDQNMFATLVTCTGYTNTFMRLDVTVAFEIDERTGEYKYPEYVGFRENGYGEYGLPEDGEEAENYFIITEKSGKKHKVLMGDENPAGSGYYVRYEGRPHVYVLKEMEETTYSSTIAKAIRTAKVEDYITPTITVPMNSNNYFDVSDFKLSQVGAITDDVLNSENFDVSTLMSDIIEFSYEPIEKRRNTLIANVPYVGKGKYEGFGINSLKVDACLQNIRDISAGRTVKVFTEEENEQGLFWFAKNCGGIGYCLEFNFNAARNENDDYKVSESYYQQIWISKRNESGSYYMYNKVFSMVVEVGRDSLEYLDMDAFDWIENGYVNGNIVFLKELEIIAPGGVSIGDSTETRFSFVIDNSDSIAELEDSPASIPSDKMQVWESGNAVDLAQFKLFYQTLLRSHLGGSATCSGSWQEVCRDAAAQTDYKNSSVTPTLVVRMKYNTKYDGSGSYEERVYCFYPYETEGYQSFATLNGKGSFYMVSSRVTKIISDLGKVFTGEEINPTAKR